MRIFFGLSQQLYCKRQVALSAISPTEVAYIDAGNADLRIYDFDGTDWTLTPTESNISGITGGDAVALATLNVSGGDTDIAFVDTNNDELRVYRWNGSTFTLQGSGFSISGTPDDPAITRLNATDIAYVDSVNDELRTYRWNGSVWVLVGSGLAENVASSAITTLTPNVIALVNNNTSYITLFESDGSVWTKLIQTNTVHGGAAQNSIAALTSNEVVHLNATDDDLEVFRFGIAFGGPPGPF